MSEYELAVYPVLSWMRQGEFDRAAAALVKAHAWLLAVKGHAWLAEATQ